MKIILGVIATALAAAALFFLVAILATLCGGLIGWAVEAVFPFVITTLNNIAGTALTGFETGCVLGFFGSFFRISSSK